MLTTAQIATLKADILAKSASGQPLEALFNAQNWDGIADFYNALASPDFWVWKTSVSRSDIYHSTSADATTWSWTIYKNQSVAEQNAWVQMFMGDIANFALANLRAGVAVIFSGAASANNTHCLAVGRRKAEVIEKLLSTGTGSTASPAVMNFEGVISGRDVLDTVHS